jgi:hypothetical protein
VGVEKQRFEDIKEDQFINHIDNEGSQLRTDYVRTIQNWEAHFPATQIFYGFYDDIIQNPQSLIERVYAFLQVDPEIAHGDGSHGERVKPRMGSRYEMPLKVQLYAAQKYLGLLTELSSRFGGHTEAWLAAAQTLLEKGDNRSTRSTN